MRKSEHGKELIFLWEGNIPVSKINLVPTSSTHYIDEKLNPYIEKEWNDICKNNPNLWDAPKWRYEFSYEKDGKIDIFISPIMYSKHCILRKLPGHVMSFYPNPLTVNVIQVTADGYIPLGVRGAGSDQKGLAPLGAGFVERFVDKDNNSINPEFLGYTVQRECLEETFYAQKKEFSMANARATGIIFGSNHDTTVSFYLPIYAKKNEVGLNNKEFSDLLFMPCRSDVLTNFLNNGSYKSILATDHVIGAVETYLKQIHKKK